MNDPNYSDLFTGSLYLSFAVYHAFGWRLFRLFRQKLRWPSLSNDYPPSSFTRWLAVTGFLVVALWNAARGFGFLHPSNSLHLRYTAFLLAFILALVVADHRDRRRSRAQTKDA